MGFHFMNNKFLPISKADLISRGWDELDIILVTGDAYVDHPSYGAALIGRVLERAGFTVGVIAMPDWRKKDDFMRLGRPRLFFGVTAGNMDSMVSNYTANKKLRSEDEYAPGGRSGLRPDRAAIIYTNRIKEAFPGVNVVLGGIEASMRRLAHYDYWSDKVRRSVLLDAKADILVYGMGEHQIVEIAKRLDKGEEIKTLDNISGTAVIKNDISGLSGYVEIPSFEDVSTDKSFYRRAFNAVYAESDPFRGKTIIQKHGERYVVQLPPAMPLSSEELDDIYELVYARNWHPSYDEKGGVPGFETVRFSVTSHRGCAGGCSFCSLFLHQGRIIQSRSRDSITREIKDLSRRRDFHGTINDIGGPTANLYKAECVKWKAAGACRDKQCLVPHKCDNLKLGYDETLRLWEDVRSIQGVKHLFIASGLRCDLLIEKYADKYLEALCAHHVSGRLKVAPEHSVNNVLRLMNKPRFETYEKFRARFEAVNKRLGKKQYLVSYFILSHPGTTQKDAEHLAKWLNREHIRPEQVQDYLPLPMTLSSCMYYTGQDPFTGEKLFVAKKMTDRKMQRLIVQH